METFKAFIKHGKQARVSQPQAEPTTHVSSVTAHSQRLPKPAGDTPAAAAPQQRTLHEPAMEHNALAAAAAAQKVAAGGKKVDPETLARIVAEENESKGKLPRYPGLDRWRLIEKMGDGAFSNVYKAVDLEGDAGEVAIKVVRKFEMNSTQVSSIARTLYKISNTLLLARSCSRFLSYLFFARGYFFFFFNISSVFVFVFCFFLHGRAQKANRWCRVMIIFIQISRNQGLLRERTSSRRSRSCGSWTIRTSSG